MCKHNNDRPSHWFLGPGSTTLSPQSSLWAAQLTLTDNLKDSTKRATFHRVAKSKNVGYHDHVVEMKCGNI